MRKNQSGFSLVELMIAVAVIGILAAVAYPSYTSYVIRANRGEAQSYLMDLAQKQQQYLMDARKYTANISDLNATEPASVSKNYTISIGDVGNAPPTFTITASPKSGTAQAGDGDLTIDQSGGKTWTGGSW
ncbi:type IV pilin protein [Metapseudomonas boanensis]|uniref:Type IV pilin protein n=1 Tax=Metapseudomonas boanensis TaxID=2822138 RepID=A0ABS5XMS0_9GAMM|nr:type IV pilin protein [Pseudomonas boanensis]MBT8768999.1 type IV pilin protein [Pseudomonas boanensis]